MSWTYEDPSLYPRDAVRLEIGDTDQADQQLSDAEIAYLLEQSSGDVLSAAANGARMLAAKYARKVDFTASKLSVAASKRVESYERLAAQLEAKARAARPGVPFVGGQSHAGDASLRSDPDAVQPPFAVGMDDLTGTAGDDDWCR